MNDNLKTAFDGYMALQDETYEFLSRTIAIDGWLKEAHRHLRENPQLDTQQLHNAWQPTFKHVYEHLLAAFLRPYRIAIFPFTPPETGSIGAPPKTTDQSMFDMWSDVQARFMKGFTETAGKDTAVNGLVFPASLNRSVEEFSKVAPMDMAREIAGDEMKAYFDVAKQVFGFTGDNQFLVPKNLIVHLQKVFEDYPKVFEVTQKYETMLERSWERASERLAAEVGGRGESVEFKPFFDTYVKLLTEEYDTLLRSREFIDTQARFIDLTSSLIISLRKTFEARMDSFPFLPFVTTTEVEALEHNVHSYKRRLDALERQVADLEERLARAGKVEVPA